MHKVLQCPELLSEIFQNFLCHSEEYPRGNLEVNRQMCLAIALTCKGFTSPALDVLWKELDDIHPLVRLIPGVYVLEDDERLVKDLPIEAADLEYMQAFANRIRYLRLSCDDEGMLFSSIEPAILAQLQQILGAKPLLPCLHSLEVNVLEDEHGDTGGSPYLSLFASGMLQNVRFNTYDDELGRPSRAPAIWLLFRNLVTYTSCQLREITLHFEHPLHAFISISRIVTLEVLNLDRRPSCARSMQDILPLASLPRLRKLCILIDDNATPSNFQPLSDFMFPALEEVAIDTDTLSATRLFTSCRFPNLKQAKLSLSDDEVNHTTSESSWLLFLQSLTKHAPRIQSLQILRHAPNAFPWSSFAPLLSLQLTNLILSGKALETLSNEDFCQVASSWPLLQHFEVGTTTWGSIDHTSLITVARQLPSLKKLSLSIRMHDASPTSLSGATYVRQTQMKELLFRHMSDDPQYTFGVKRVHDIARFLAALFPNARIHRFLAYNLATELASSGMRYLDDFVKASQEDLARGELMAKVS